MYILLHILHPFYIQQRSAVGGIDAFTFAQYVSCVIGWEDPSLIQKPKALRLIRLFLLNHFHFTPRLVT
jgi:hypothetical protein